jgi:predicted NBD/HSP70 family sugar kinase
MSRGQEGTSPTAGLDQSAVRRMNTAVVLRALAAESEPVTLQRLGEMSGLSRRTIEVILDALVRAGWAAEAEHLADGGAGRPAKRFRHVRDRAAAAALRVDTHLAHAMIVDLGGQVLGRSTIRLGEDYFDPDRTVVVLAAALEEARTQSGLPADRILAAGLAAGGVIDTERGLVRRLVNAPKWTGFPLAERLSALLSMPCSIDNDANLAALAEVRAGVAADAGTLAWLVHGFRTGAGFVIDGAIHRGRQGAAGELIESRVLALDQSPLGGFGMLTSPVAEEHAGALRLAEAARHGEADAVRAADAFAAELAGIIDVLSWTIAPDLVVLGGGLETAADVIEPRVATCLERLGVPPVRTAATALGADAMLLGAAHSALAAVERAIFASIVDVPAASENGAPE